MTTDENIQPAIAKEYLRLADVLAALSEAEWDRPSLCENWSVREVVAHVTMPARYDDEAFMAELSARNFDFGRLSNEIAARDGTLPVTELVANLRSETLHRWVPPDGGVHGALSHAVIHGLDATVPLGVSGRPADTLMEIVLDDLTEGGVHAHFGTDIKGRRLEATDLEWSYGRGRGLRGTGADLALVLCGRQIGPERFDGDPL